MSYRVSTAHCRILTCVCAVGVAAANVSMSGALSPAAAQTPATAVASGDADAVALRDSLFRKSLKKPTDVALAMAYAKACIAIKDYEGAIGALERVLYYLPGDKPTQAELGFLYTRLRSPQMARHYLDAAADGGGLDATTQAKVATATTANESDATNHPFGSLQVGLRSQSNAAFNSDNNILRISQQDYVVDHPHDSGSDANAFQIAQIGYDYDLGDQRGDLVETRVAGYATQQFRFKDLNVGLYDVTIGPRFFIAPDTLPGWSIKPYAAGGQIFLAGERYLASGGAGIVADLPVRTGLLLQPGVEVRRVSFANVSVFSSLNSGEATTASLTGTAILNPRVTVVGRLFFTRDSAAASYQSLNNWAEEIALVVQAPSPVPLAPQPWTISPYVKLLQTRFDGPNPYVDTFVTRGDDQYESGLVLNAPLTRRFGIVTNLQYAKVASNIPNYRLRNLSILAGPLVLF